MEVLTIRFTKNFKISKYSASFTILQELLGQEQVTDYTSPAYRFTDEGISVGDGLSPETYGFDLERAVYYYKLAVDELIASGDCVPGTALDPTVIRLELNIIEANVSLPLMGAYIEAAYEAAFQDDINHVIVDIVVVEKTFPEIYYDYTMVGNFDLAYGAVSGGAMDAAAFLETYSSDNRSGFSFNWGIDTSIAEIVVDYTDYLGVRHSEIWSFDAISTILNGLMYIENGEEIDVPTVLYAIPNPTEIEFTVNLL